MFRPMLEFRPMRDERSEQGSHLVDLELTNNSTSAHVASRDISISFCNSQTNCPSCAMHADDAQLVLRCELCNKPFDKESTLKRHGYYCRARRTGIATRVRSCETCARSKARCDNRHPSCSRCMNKGIECHYPTAKPSQTLSKFHDTDEKPIDQRQGTSSCVAKSPGIRTLNEGTGNNSIAFGTVADNLSPSSESLEGQFFNSDIDLIELSDPSTYMETPEVWSALIHKTPTTSDQALQIQPATFSPSLLMLTPSTHTSRSFVQRSSLSKGAQRVASLILHNLKSYPAMMLRHNCLPPFIHQSLGSHDDDNDVEPLNNCLNLVHMLGSQFQGNRKLFWKNVRTECERFCAEHLQLNRWESLTALQALAIYIFIRLSEGETEYNNLDSLLVKTVTMVATQSNQLYAIGDVTPGPENHSLAASWKQWIFEESIRRMCIIYQVMGMLVDFEPAAMCSLDTNLVLAPLPARKQLWEASDEFGWMAETGREPGRQKMFGLAANGDLVRVDVGQLLYGDARAQSGCAANWDEWCAGMDGLGGLIMLAASFVVQ